MFFGRIFTISPSIEFWWVLIIGTIVIITFTVIIIAGTSLHRKNLIKSQEEKLSILEKSEWKYRNLVESMNESVFIVDKLENISYMNNQLLMISGIENGDISKLSIKEIFHGSGSNKLSREIKSVFSNFRLKKLEFNTTINNKNYWLETILIPQYGPNTGEISVLGISHDFTSKKTMEKRLKDLVTTLKSQQKTLKMLTNEVIRAQDEERKRISRELHDEIGQSLTAISFNLEILKGSVEENDEFINRFNDCKKIVERTIEDVHRFTYELRPVMLDDFGLITAIKSHARSYQSRTGITVKINSQSNVDNINNDLKTTIFRIFQECLTNVAKHAKASTIVFDLKIYHNEISFQIADNGIGFDYRKQISDPKSGGLGLKGVRERVELMGGSIEIKSKLNNGTKLSVNLPFGTA